MLKKLYKKDGIIMVFNDKIPYNYGYFLINHYKDISKKLIEKKYYQTKNFTYLEDQC